jgi:hypothetical protein
MRKLNSAPWVFAALAVLMFAAPAAAQSTRATVALIDFDFGTIDHWWGNQDIGKGIADLLVDGIVDDGRYGVI